MKAENTFRSGFVAIVGRPNVGKSTLLNRIIGEKIAIVSNRPQTTRNTILGIYNAPDVQIVFMDTPGYHQPKTRLGNYMVQSIQDALEGIETMMVLTDTSNCREKDADFISEMSEKKCRKLLVLNKIDLVEPKDLLGIIQRFRDLGYDEIYPVSAKTGDGIDELLQDLTSHLPKGPKYYPDDMITDQPERAICAEIIREKALLNLTDEVPHGIGVEILSFNASDTLIEIHATIYCERDSHKAIIIGKNGSKIKEIGSQSRHDIEQLLNTHVNLQLWVKVRQDWRNNPLDLKTLGYIKQK